MKWLRLVPQKEDLSSVRRILLMKCEGKRQFGRTGRRCRVKIKKSTHTQNFKVNSYVFDSRDLR